MIKNIVFYAAAFINLSCGLTTVCSMQIFNTEEMQNKRFYIPLLKVIVLDSLLNFKKYPQQKQIINKKLREKEINIHQLDFYGITLKDLDFSGMYFNNLDFRGCIFDHVDLSNSDLTGTLFNRATFISSNLEGAILYYPLNDLGQPLMEKAFRANNVYDHYNLVKQYSDLMKKAKETNNHDLFEQAKCLNKLFAGLHLQLREKSFYNFDLTDIDLENADLLYANLSGARLSENVVVPYYSQEDRRELFNFWVNGNKEERDGYQKLVNAKFDLITGVDPEDLRQGIQAKKNLRNAYLYNADLQHLNLKNKDFTGANLKNAKLQGSKLQDANFNHANLCFADLRGSNLEGANLAYASLEFAELQNADLRRTNFIGANLPCANLQGVNLRGSSFDESNLVFNYIVKNMKGLDETFN